MITATKMVALLWLVIGMILTLWALHLNQNVKRDLDEAEEHLDSVKRLGERAAEHLRHAQALRDEAAARLKEAEEYRDKCRAAYLAAEGAEEEKGE